MGQGGLAQLDVIDFLEVEAALLVEVRFYPALGNGGHPRQRPAVLRIALLDFVNWFVLFCVFREILFDEVVLLLLESQLHSW